MIYALEQTTGKENKILTNAITEADASNIDNIVDILINIKAFEFSRKCCKR